VFPLFGNGGNGTEKMQRPRDSQENAIKSRKSADNYTFLASRMWIRHASCKSVLEDFVSVGSLRGRQNV